MGPTPILEMARLRSPSQIMAPAYMRYIGMCGPKGYGFSPVLVINRVSIFADLGYFGHK